MCIAETTINAQSGVTLLQEIEELKDGLPVNCIFNKGKTGCGGTELALTQKGHAIIAVPYRTLAMNKETPRD